jgi:hypothetical protein
MTLSRMAFNIIKYITTLYIMTLRITTFNIMILDIMNFIKKLLM